MIVGMRLIVGGSVGSDGALLCRLKKGYVRPFNGIENTSPGGAPSSPESSGSIMSRCMASDYNKQVKAKVKVGEIGDRASPST